MPTPYREPHAGQFLGTLAYRKRATRRQARRTQFWRRTAGPGGRATASTLPADRGCVNAAAQHPGKRRPDPGPLHSFARRRAPRTVGRRRACSQRRHCRRRRHPSRLPGIAATTTTSWMSGGAAGTQSPIPRRSNGVATGRSMRAFGSSAAEVTRSSRRGFAFTRRPDRGKECARHLHGDGGGGGGPTAPGVTLSVQHVCEESTKYPEMGALHNLR